MNQRLIFTPAAAAFMLSATGIPVNAEEYVAPSVADYASPRSSVSLGIGNWSGERDRYGMFDNLRGNDTVLLFDADLNMRDDATGTWLTGRLRDLGIDSRAAGINYEHQGDWGIGVEYDAITRAAPYTVNTGMTGLGTEIQVVPIGGTGYAPGSGSDRILTVERESLGLSGFKQLTPNLRFMLDFKNQDKDGNRHWGRGDEPEFAAEPIDSVIRQLEAKLEFTGDRFQVNGGYYGSWYDNHNDLVFTWGDDGAASRIAYLSVPLDNEAHQLFVNGGYDITPSTRGTFKLSYTHATANEHIPTSDIGGPGWTLPFNGAYFPQSASAPTNLDGEINTTLVQLGLTARPSPRLSVFGSLRYHKVDEQTPRWLVIDGASDVHGTPMDYTKMSGRLEGTYSLPMDLSLTGGIERVDEDRTVPYGSDSDADGRDDERYVPFRNDLHETTYRVQLSKSMSESVNGSVTYSRANRGGSRYSDAIHAHAPINPFNIADRKRDKWGLSVDWTPSYVLGFQFNVEDARDDYGPDRNPYGLSRGSEQLYAVDADYAINDDWHVTAWAAQNRNQTKQAHASFDRITENHELDAYSDLSDTGRSFGLSVTGEPSHKLRVGADLEWSRFVSRYNDTVIPIGEGGDPDTGYPAGVTPLPNITTRTTKLNLFAEYDVADHSQLRFDLIHEIWKTNDWTWTFSDGSPFIYTGRSSSDGTLVSADPRQSATFVGVRYKYSFQ